MYLKDYIKDFREYTSYDDFYNNYEVIVPEDFNFVYDVVDRAGEEFPDREALVWHDQAGNEKRFSFSDLSKASSKAAHYFKSLGIAKGDAVMVMLKNSYEFWYCLLGLHRIGAIAVPATHMLTNKDILYRNNKASIKAVVCVNDERLMEAVDATKDDSEMLEIRIVVDGKKDGWLEFHEGIIDMPEVFDRPSGEEKINNDDTMLLYFTSGTTGEPKMVEHCFTYPLGHITTAQYWHRVIDGGLHYTLADTGWAKAVWGKIYGQWICGSAVFVSEFETFTPTDVLLDIEKYGITTFCAPPTVYRFLIKDDLTKYDLSSLKYCTVAGEPLSPTVFAKFKEYTGIELCEAYGQTEATVISGTFPTVKPKPGSMGKAAPGYQLQLVDEDNNPVDVGEEGEIVVVTKASTPVGMFAGYYRAEEATAKVWSDGLYHTGDTAWKDEDGYFWFVGRADDVIKSSGYRIGPFEVESALLTHPAVLECAITGVPHPVRGQVVKATITLTKGYSPSEELKVDIQDHVKRVTAPYKYPRVVEFVEALPKTISGKIRRTEIRKKK
ncbi:acetyl-CoA synthetase [Puteibacter caeruleilacunae]|nr:acetyl-CoA synthetase [Puteibacter caeruleilacunae]